MTKLNDLADLIIPYFPFFMHAAIRQKLEDLKTDEAFISKLNAYIEKYGKN